VTKTYEVGGQRIALRRDNVLYYVYSDHLGSTTLLTTAQGQEVAGTRLQYYPYGAPRPAAQTATHDAFALDYTAATYTGQRREVSTGLMYYGARFYDPLVGRFLQADSIVPEPGNPQSLNRYSYTLNNPLRYTDPTGHCPLCVVLMLGGMALLLQGDSPDLHVTPEDIASQRLGGALFVGGATLAGGTALAGVGPAAGTTGTEAVTAACADGDCTNEVRAVGQTVIADTDVVMGKLIQPGQGVVTPQTLAELEKLQRSGAAQGFGTISADAQAGFAQTQAFFNAVLPNAQGKAGDVYNLATTAMNNAKFLTADKATIFNPLMQAVKNGLVTGYATANQVVMDVPGIGQVIVELVEHR